MWIWVTALFHQVLSIARSAVLSRRNKFWRRKLHRSSIPYNAKTEQSVMGHAQSNSTSLNEIPHTTISNTLHVKPSTGVRRW